ncbi:MAG: hypothetical protein ACXWZ2_11310 [Mycobacterium sp.]
MCYPDKCPRCGKTGWAGCGQHVDDVMRSVPPAEQCTCGGDSARHQSAEIVGGDNDRDPRVRPHPRLRGH